MKPLVPLITGLILAGILCGQSVPAAGPTPTASLLASVPIGGSPDALALTLRGLLLAELPNPLYEKSTDWGKTKRVWNGVNHYSDRNQGKWRKLRITARNLPTTLALNVRDVQRLSPERMVFSVALSFDAQVDYEQQNWSRGVRIYAGSVRARLRVNLALQCESLARVENSGGLLPNMLFRMRVLQAHLGYENIVVEHVAGFGGTTAKLIGDMVHGSLKKLHPGLERHLLEKANAAIIKAGDTREIRLGLVSLFKGKP